MSYAGGGTIYFHSSKAISYEEQSTTYLSKLTELVEESLVSPSMDNNLKNDVVQPSFSFKEDKDIYNFESQILVFSSNKNLTANGEFSSTLNTTLAISVIQNENVGPLDTIYLDNFINLHVINSNISVFYINCTSNANVDLSTASRDDDAYISNRWKSRSFILYDF